MALSSTDQSIVANLRREYGNKIMRYSDDIIAAAWANFSQSDEYPDDNCACFPAWCDMQTENLL